MLKWMMIGAGALALAGIGASGAKHMEQDRAAAVAKFHLTADEQPMMKMCESTLRSEKLSFKSGVDEIPGCACIARQIHDKLKAPNERAFASTVLSKMLVTAVKDKDPQKTTEGLEKASEDHNVSDARAAIAVFAILDTLDICSKNDTYLSDADKAKAADEAKDKRKKSKAAFDQLVREGKMSRAEADKRLATIK